MTSADKESEKQLDDLEQLANAHYKSREYGKALDFYNQALRSHREKASLHVGRGNCLRELKRYIDALNAYTEALLHDTQCAAAYNGQGLVLKQQRIQEALAAFDQAIRFAVLSEDIADYYYNKGLVLYDLHRYADALEAFCEARELDPKNLKYHQMIKGFSRNGIINNGTIHENLFWGNAFLKQKQFREAILEFNDAIDANKKAKRAYVGKGHAFFGLKQYTNALHDYQKAVELGASDIEMYHNMAHIFQSCSLFTEALHCYELSLRLHPNQPVIHIKRGDIFFQQATYEQAIAAYQQALSLDANNAHACLRMGDCLMLCQREQEAASFYVRSLQLAEKVLTAREIWFLAHDFSISCRPATIQFALVLSSLIKSSADVPIQEAYTVLGKLYQDVFEHGPQDVLDWRIKTISSLLQKVSPQEASALLYAMAGNNLARIVNLLTIFAPYPPHNLSPCIRELIRKKLDVTQNIDLALRLYPVLHTYHVADEERIYFYAQVLVAQHRYNEALSQLSDLTQKEEAHLPKEMVVEVQWLLALTLGQCEQSPYRQIEALRKFIGLSPSDKRVKEAWLRIGDLYSTLAGESIETIKAYQEAEKLGAIVPALLDYRRGNWDTEYIPSLRTHFEYPHPIVVVLDLECDYQPEAVPGSRVFEIGAVRMKGGTELDRYHAIIRRDFVAAKVKDRQSEAQDPASVVQTLRQFIGSAIVVGHNLRAFDAQQLHGMGLLLDNDQIIDTLEFARLLYPDSILHHLSLLCERLLGPSIQREWHHALADAQACAALFHALGEELIRRGEGLLAGFRAFISPGSAFDRAVLQPRKIAADPTVSWELHPSPTPVHILARIEGQPASPRIVESLHHTDDVLVESYDPDGAYVQSLLPNQRNVVTVSSRTRLERMLTLSQARKDLFVLPNPHTLLCPQRMRQCIETESDPQEKLVLFCLYQASHNHDVSTLYTARLPIDDVSHEEQIHLSRRRTLLREACCGYDRDHVVSCSGFVAARQAITSSFLLLATHKDLLTWEDSTQLNADLLIIDDADELQMHFAEYLAVCIHRDHFVSQSRTPLEAEALRRLDVVIQECARRYISRPVLQERLPLQILVSALTTVGQHGEKDGLSFLEEAGPTGRRYGLQLREWCIEAKQDVIIDDMLRASWLDLQRNTNQEIERWTFRRLCRNVPTAFDDCFGKPFTRRIICGNALSLGKLGTTFLTRYFGLSEGLPLLQDERPSREVLIPDRHTVGSASFLRRRSWAEEVGSFLYHWVSTHQEQSIMLSLRESAIAHALTDALHEHIQANRSDIKQQLLSPRLHWSLSKIAERVADPERYTLTIVRSVTRRNVLTTPVAVEATGPLRFLNRRDPLVAAHLRFFKQKYPEEGQFHAYLLPQALLELKTRLSSPARTHIILDGALRSKMYYDAICSLAQGTRIHDTLSPLAQDKQRNASQLKQTFSQHLERAGFHAHVNVTEEDLHLTLQSLWNFSDFKPPYPRVDGKKPISQKEIINAVFERKKKDQLIVVATGGGKSLCFQLPAVLLAEDVVPRVTLVISPLIALMQDQVEKLHARGLFSAVVFNSNLLPSKRANYLRGIKNGDYSIIYMAPEQIHSQDICDALSEREIGFIAIDEAHCVSQWGHHFRTDYFALKEWINTYLCHGQKRQFPMMALTATARRTNPQVQGLTQEISTVQDIIEKLGLDVAPREAIITSPERTELEFHVEQIRLHCPICAHDLHTIGKEIFGSDCSYVVPVKGKDKNNDILWRKKCERMIALLTDGEGYKLRERWDRGGEHYQRGIIYCRTRLTTEEVAKEITASIPALRGNVAFYHAGMLADERKHVYTRFINNNADNGVRIVVATNAFGMGIDAERLGFVIHFDVPATPEAYYQEAGRAGRNFKNEEKAQCILLYHDRDLEDQRWMTSQNKITEQDVASVYEAICGLNRQRQCNQQILVTEEEIALHTGVEPGQVDTLLYYLEYHAMIDGKWVIRREENATHIWDVRFAAHYQQNLTKRYQLSSVANQLLTFFQNVEQFRLTETQDTRLDLNSLVQHLNQHDNSTKRYFSYDEVKNGLINLINAGILVRVSRGRLVWRLNYDDIVLVLMCLKEEIQQLLQDIARRQEVCKDQKVIVNIDELMNKYELNVLSRQEHYAHFLFLLSQKSGEDEPLLNIFKRDIRHLGSISYAIQLNGAAKEQKIVQRIEQIFAEMRRTVEKLKYFEATPEMFDPLCVAPEDKDRQRLYQHLLWLDLFGLLSYVNDPLLGQARNITLLQEGEASDLHIDLRSLYAQEAYKEKKLSFMKEYAETSQKERATLFKGYFLGEKPLIEPYCMPLHFTEEQQQAVQQADGYCLVEGPAGSGKTTVLVEHLKYLIYHLHIPAQRIIVFTHNKNAINSIHATVEACELYDVDEQLPEMLTINAFANRIFKNYQAWFKRSDGQPYYSDERPLKQLNNSSKDREREVQKVLESLMWIRDNEWRQEVYEAGFTSLSRQTLLAINLNDTDHFQKAINCLRQVGIFPACSPQQEEIIAALYKWKTQMLYEVALYYAVYVVHLELMGQEGWYTFDDQVLFALALLRTNPHLRNRYSYEHIVIDEFQDVNGAQIDLLRFLTSQHHNLFALGDSKQDIRVSNTWSDSCMQKLEQINVSHPLSTICLTRNFRAAPELQDFVHAIRTMNVHESIKEAYRRRDEHIVISEISSTVKARTYENDKINTALLHQMIDDVIKQCHHLALPAYGNIALIVARSGWLEECEQYLKDRHYPFILLEKPLYQTPHIERILLYLRLIADKGRDTDTKHLLRFCIFPKLSAQQIKQLKKIAREKQLSWFNILCSEEHVGQLFSPQQRQSLRSHIDCIQTFSAHSLVSKVWQALEKLEKSPLSEVTEQDDRIEEQQKVQQELQSYTVKQALEYVKHRISFVEKGESSNGVILTTVDYAKSQEFDTVFLLGFDSLRKEERFYVGASRAKQRLVLLIDGQTAQKYHQLVPKSVATYSSNDRDLEDDHPF